MQKQSPVFYKKNCSVRNSPRQSANAEAYLHFIAFASAIKTKNETLNEILENEIFCRRKKDFFHKKNTFLQGTNYSCASISIIHTFISYIFNSLLYLLYYAWNEVIDVMRFVRLRQQKNCRGTAEANNVFQLPLRQLFYRRLLS